MCFHLNNLQGKNGTECANDYLTIMEGAGSESAAENDSSVLGSFCGIEPPSLATNTNKITVLFKSDNMFRYPGFKCRFR